MRKHFNGLFVGFRSERRERVRPKRVSQVQGNAPAFPCASENTKKITLLYSALASFKKHLFIVSVVGGSSSEIDIYIFPVPPARGSRGYI